MTAAIAPPDFVMVGGQQDGKVYLLASKELKEVELRSELEEPGWVDRRLRSAYPPEYRYFLNSEMKSWVTVVADSYPEAFRILFEQWTPERESAALEQGRPRELKATIKEVSL